MSDIIKELRQYANDINSGEPLEDDLFWKAADEIERLRAVSAELCDAMDDCITWLSSGFAPQSQAMALKKAAKAKAKFRALEPKP